jgi:hypothetical protein
MDEGLCECAKTFIAFGKMISEMEEHATSRPDPICLELYGTPEKIVRETSPRIRDALQRGDCEAALQEAAEMVMRASAYKGCKTGLGVAKELTELRQQMPFGMRRSTWGKPPGSING